MRCAPTLSLSLPRIGEVIMLDKPVTALTMPAQKAKFAADACSFSTYSGSSDIGLIIANCRRKVTANRPEAAGFSSAP